MRGVVLEATTREPLGFATVQFEGKTAGATTDPEGRFSAEIKEPAARLKVSYMGYQTAFIDLKPGQANTGLEIRLEEASNTLKEVVVRTEKYRNKDNPAVELIREVIAHKERNRREGLDFFSFEQYEKVEFALNNVDERLRNGFLFRKMPFLFDHADTSANGSVSLPFYLYERLADVYFRRDPRDEKTVVQAERSTSLPGFFDEQGISSYVQNMYQQVDIYDNQINLATVEFTSPLSPLAPTIYRFYLQDTTQLKDTRVVRLYFAPRNKADRAFDGNMWVALDGSYAVRKIELSVPRDINLNWVTDLFVEQEFDWVESAGDALGATRRLLLRTDRVSMNFGVRQDSSSRSLIGRKTTSYRGYSLNQPLSDQFFRFSGDTRYTDNATAQSEQFWSDNRHEVLSEREKGIQETIDTLNNYRPFKRAVSIGRILFEGYHSIPGLGVDIGPVNTFYSFNPVEGFRGRFGGRTNLRFARDIQLEGYLAYGAKDERWKGMLSATYAFGASQLRRFPLDQVRFWYQDDVKIPGQELQFVQEDNFLLSFKRGVNDKMIYNRVLGAEYLKETAAHFLFAVSLKSTRQQPAGVLAFRYGNVEQPQYDPEIKTTELGIHLRYAPNERFYQGATYRTPIYTKHPKFDLWYTLGARGVLGSSFQYHSVRFKAEKVFYLSQLGWSHVVLDGGRIFGTVPFPLLTAHRANQTFAYQLESYNLMNFLEFVSDKYASVSVTHNLGGLIFNRIPLLRKLKWREVGSFKALWGGLDTANRPTAENGLLHFPTDASGTPLTYTLGKKPYMEASAGIGNIFKVLRIDYVRRLTYLDQPNVAKWGIRARVKFEF
ncbi:MAG: carboxypeptidase-like regulatory domain-containing protein [Saprospirales bacterium]|nr:carboxypeptidase-like regulatory domain-containing protein [Saprospirales bacterium]MBK8922774.1 carboxypeptidase-like regulatory domain-containing protein [Saprospirales bacterium]